jgi:hypothetical protein
MTQNASEKKIVLVRQRSSLRLLGCVAHCSGWSKCSKQARESFRLNRDVGSHNRASVFYA